MGKTKDMFIEIIQSEDLERDYLRERAFMQEYEEELSDIKDEHGEQHREQESHWRDRGTYQQLPF